MYRTTINDDKPPQPPAPHSNTNTGPSRHNGMRGPNDVYTVAWALGKFLYLFFDFIFVFSTIHYNRYVCVSLLIFFLLFNLNLFPLVHTYTESDSVIHEDSDVRTTAGQEQRLRMTGERGSFGFLWVSFFFSSFF